MTQGKNWKILAATALLGGLSGCATISEKSCAYDSWYDVGFRGAMKNHDRADYLDDILKDCGKHGFQPVFVELARGFDEGTERFCDPANGFAWGRKGNSYNGVCGTAEFSNAYADGYRLHEIEVRRSNITSRLASIRSRLEEIEEELDNPETTEEQAKAFSREYAKLRRERRDLNRELEALPVV